MGIQDLNAYPTHGTLIAEEINSDSTFRADWERLALARAVAGAVLAYRGEYGLSQAALGRELGMAQPQVSRLEGGEHLPTIDTLVKLATALGMEFTLDVRPENAAAKNVTRTARERAVSKTAYDGAAVLLAVA
jgi:transcriptional regulator with XRE-family HTH domain